MLCKHSFNRYISRSANAGRKLATLGPSGTSSYAAARHFAQDYPADIALFPTYEEAADAVRAAPGESALIVANAYANINRFYISDVLHPIGALACLMVAHDLTVAIDPDVHYVGVFGHLDRNADEGVAAVPLVRETAMGTNRDRPQLGDVPSDPVGVLYIDLLDQSLVLSI